MHAIYDTLVFLAISFRILSYTVVGDTFEARVKSFFRGTGLPSLSRSILQGGQLYYLFAVVPSHCWYALMCFFLQCDNQFQYRDSRRNACTHPSRISTDVHPTSRCAQ